MRVASGRFDASSGFVLPMQQSVRQPAVACGRLSPSFGFGDGPLMIASMRSLRFIHAELTAMLAPRPAPVKSKGSGKTKGTPGIRQGAVESPHLFSATIDWIQKPLGLTLEEMDAKEGSGRLGPWIGCFGSGMTPQKIQVPNS